MSIISILVALGFQGIGPFSYMKLDLGNKKGEKEFIGIDYGKGKDKTVRKLINYVRRENE